MDDSTEGSSVGKGVIAAIVGLVIAGGVGIGYAVHEHSSAQAMAAQKQTLAAENQQMTAQLSATQSQLSALAAKVNSLTANETTSAPSAAPAGTAIGRRTGARRGSAYDSRFNKLQTQLEAQGKEIDAARSDLADTRNDLSNTRTELSGSIAHTHDELVVLEKRGERNYIEFDITKSKEFKHEGPISIRLSKANSKRGYADLLLIVDDRNLQQKHVNLYQPSMFYEPDSPQPVEVVINDISKDHIHGYVSAPKYRKSELDAMASNNASSTPNPQQSANSNEGDNGIVGEAPATNTDQSTNNNSQLTTRKRLTLPSNEPNQQ